MHPKLKRRHSICNFSPVCILWAIKHFDHEKNNHALNEDTHEVIEEEERHEVLGLEECNLEVIEEEEEENTDYYAEIERMVDDDENYEAMEEGEDDDANHWVEIKSVLNDGCTEYYSNSVDDEESFIDFHDNDDDLQEEDESASSFSSKTSTKAC